MVHQAGQDVQTESESLAVEEELNSTEPHGLKLQSRLQQQAIPMQEFKTLDPVGGDANDREVVEPATESAREPCSAANEQEHQSLSTSAFGNLYISHFLSTWNSRLFEFGAVLFLASIFPGTLLPLSIYAIIRSGVAILFANMLGTWIDSGSRIVVVKTSIIGQRLAVAASCASFWVLEKHHARTTRPPFEASSLRTGLFALVVVLACVEKLCSVMNLVAVERDWLVVITEGNEQVRRVVNARMRRIDLFCKLVGPLAISLIAIPGTIIAVWTTLAMSLISVTIEYICISKTYQKFPELKRYEEQGGQERISINVDTTSTPVHRRMDSLKAVAFQTLPIKSLPFYFHQRVCLPSFSLTLLYFTVLSFSGQMITYLMTTGYTSAYVGAARAISTVFELSATWIAPRLMKRISVVRTGIWSVMWQTFWLTAGVTFFLSEIYTDDSAKGKIISDTGLAVGVALSRVGLWGYDLSAQNIVQDGVDLENRGKFSTVEAAFQNLFELLSYVTTIIWSRPAQFRWPVIISAAAVYAAGGLYTFYVRRTRGHLVHIPHLIGGRASGNDAGRHED